MRTPETSKLFSRWENPENGVVSWILTQRQAAVQQTFYYTTPSYTDDGRFHWFRVGDPAAGAAELPQTLAVVDFEADEVRVYPETKPSQPTGRPLVDLASGEIYRTDGLDLWKRGPLAEDRIIHVNRFPDDLAPGRVDRIAHHPRFSPDPTRRSVNIDTRIVNPEGTVVVHFGEMPLDGSPVEIWARYEGREFNHAQLSPTDPEVMMFANEYFTERGEALDPAKAYHRMWMIRRGEPARPILNEPVTHSGHEWWDAEGQHVWYVHYGVGIKKVELSSAKQTLMWPGHLSHGDSERSGRYLVADKMSDPKMPDCHVVFYDTLTGKEVEIVNRPPSRRAVSQCAHLHPHPHFCGDDRYICYTTSVHDRVDLALVAVEPLKAATR